jgi:hypothetical protein
VCQHHATEVFGMCVTHGGGFEECTAQAQAALAECQAGCP